MLRERFIVSKSTNKAVYPKLHIVFAKLYATDELPHPPHPVTTIVISSASKCVIIFLYLDLLI